MATDFLVEDEIVANETGADLATFRDDVVKGLSQHRKRIPCKYFYDERGSRLFDEICELEDYYLTRSELAIMERFAPEMGVRIGPGVMLVEYGSGSGTKTRILLDHLPKPAAYVPVDISKEHLLRSAGRIAADYPGIEVLPVCVDFTQPFALPRAHRVPSHAAVYFPGSTIGNFSGKEARRLLQQIAVLCDSGGGLLIGIDLRKDRSVIEAAYNDREGVTAAFNLNLLRRINRELEGDFDLAAFCHRAEYCDAGGRIEISLVSRREQIVTIDDQRFAFEAAEPILTEYSHKYSIAGFASLAREAGLALRKSWTDDGNNFAVLHLVVES